jgi:CHAD domain-containing protein
MPIQWNEERTLTENLSRRLPRLARKYFAQGNKALSVDRSWEEMHDFRLVSKRFRYTLELFRDVYGQSIEPFIEDLKGLQSHLGDVNDAVTAHELLKDVPDSEEARSRLLRRADKKRDKLRAYWSDRFAMEGTDARWIDYLKFGLLPSGDAGQV